MSLPGDSQRGEADVRAGILRWLTARGLLLEMEVARELALAGWDVTQSEPYQDPRTGKARETDINARLQQQFGRQFLCLELVVECKSSVARPWLLLSSATSYKGSSWAVHTAVSHLGQEFLTAVTVTRKEAMLKEADSVFADLPVFSWPARRGFRFAEGQFDTSRANQDLRDGGFAAVTQLDSALGQFYKESESRPPWVLESICEILIPVVVVNDNLFECWMEEDGQVKIERIHRGLLIASRDLDSPLSNYIVVTDREGFRALSADAKRSFERLVELVPEIMPRALQLLKEDVARELSEQARALELAGLVPRGRGTRGDVQPKGGRK